MTDHILVLRRLESEDLPFVYTVYTDSAVREQSRVKEPPTYSSFTQWALSQPYFWVVLRHSVKIGYGRFDCVDRRAELSYALTEGARSKRWATPLIQLLTAEAQSVGCTTIQAVVQASNTSSLRALLRAGYSLPSTALLVLTKERV